MEINLETLLGTLAAYFAIMAVLAVGTEVVLDILKIKMLKKPISPKETVEELKASLKEWVGPEDWEQLEKRVEHMDAVIREVDTTLAETRIGLRRLRDQTEPLIKEGQKLAPEELATVMRQLEGRYKALSEHRLAWIRFASLVIGIGWAIVLQINSLDLLSPVIGDVINDMLGGPNTFWYVVAGIALSGLGASAGSSFWHDQMARLRQAGEVVDTTEELRKQAAAIASGIAAGQSRDDK